MRTLSRTSPSSRAYHVKQKRDNFTVTTLFRAKRRSYIDMGRLPLSAISSEKGLSERHSSSARVAFVACGCPIWAKHVRGTAAVGGHVRGTGKKQALRSSLRQLEPSPSPRPIPIPSPVSHPHHPQFHFLAHSTSTSTEPDLHLPFCCPSSLLSCCYLCIPLPSSSSRPAGPNCCCLCLLRQK
jgi:hypothetical protein